MTDWHPIDTAPYKEAVEVIAKVGGSPFIAFRDEVGQWRMTSARHLPVRRKPIMWRPKQIQRQEAAE